VATVLEHHHADDHAGTLIASLLRALDAFRIFDLPYVLTGGGPADSTEVLSTLSTRRCSADHSMAWVGHQYLCS
jgi:hypothetical protein